MSNTDRNRKVNRSERNGGELNARANLENGVELTLQRTTSGANMEVNKRLLYGNVV